MNYLKLTEPYYALEKGYAWNPFRKFPRNLPCFCASGKKAKKCCLPIIAQAVLKDNADFIKANWQDFLDGKLTTQSVKPK